jgi:cytochrome b subunit of formate dehydrogenase
MLETKSIKNKAPKMSKDKANKYLRFSISERIEHWVQMISFTLLGLTGLVQKFATAQISVELIAILGGIESVRIIHRIASMGLMFGTIYHIGAVGYKTYVKRSKFTMLPSLNDVKAAWGTFLYNLKLKKVKPQQGRYTFDEKFEYWAFVWGTIVMGLTGFMLWNPITATKVFPGVIIPAAKAAHSGEALLAVLAIIIWHFYHVHIRHFNKSMFTGYLTEQEMIDEHTLELADIKAGLDQIPQDPKQVERRKKIFFPTYTFVAAVMVVGVFLFVAYEETAIATVPPAETVAVFIPLTPTPLPTPIPTATPAPVGNTWNEGIAAMMIDRCGTCHAAGIFGGLDLSGYQSALSGGGSGAAIVPGNPDESLLVQVQLEGNHPGQFNETELETIVEWIKAGAPQE